MGHRDSGSGISGELAVGVSAGHPWAVRVEALGAAREFILKARKGGAPGQQHPQLPPRRLPWACRLVPGASGALLPAALPWSPPPGLEASCAAAASHHQIPYSAGGGSCVVTAAGTASDACSCPHCSSRSPSRGQASLALRRVSRLTAEAPAVGNAAPALGEVRLPACDVSGVKGGLSRSCPPSIAGIACICGIYRLSAAVVPGRNNPAGSIRYN